MAAHGASRGNGFEVSSDASQPTSITAPAATSDSSSTFSLQITNFKLNGHNFLHGSISVQMVNHTKGKIEYIDGFITQPLADSSSYSAKDAQNSMVMVWITHSMDDNLAEIYLLYPTADSIWDIVTSAYSDFEDSFLMFDLRT